jgi:thiamine-monophosphate kinase
VAARPGEFEIIARYFRPLAGDPAALGLLDDAAVLVPPPGQDLVLTTDTIVAGVHFLADEAPDLVARRLLRVNLSDLAAMGACPLGYLLNTAFPSAIDEAWIGAFAAGLAEDQARFQISLLGGDTVATPGPLTLTATALGAVAPGRALKRGGAKAGDEVYVTGTIGDGALGLQARRGGLAGLAAAHRASLAHRFLLPEPRLAVGLALSEAAGGLASAAADVSDGLVADLGHIGKASGLAATIEWEAVPLSPAARAALAADPALLATILTGGDDYELVLTAGAGSASQLQAVAAGTGVPLTRIGRMGVGSGVTVVDRLGQALALPQAGFRHF